MSVYDQELREKLQRLDGIEAQLAQHARTTRLGLISLAGFALVVLALLGYHIARL